MSASGRPSASASALRSIAVVAPHFQRIVVTQFLENPRAIPGEQLLALVCEEFARLGRPASDDVLHCAETGGRLATLDVIDATYARALRPDWITIEASDPMSDFHAAIGDDVLDLRSSRPPALLRLHGDALRGIRHLLLNRRPIHLPALDGRTAIVLSGADWSAEASLPRSLVLSA